MQRPPGIVIGTRRRLLSRLDGRTAAALLLAMLTATSAPRAAEPAASEYAVKAAIVYKIAKFVTWPGEVHPARAGALTICLPADDSIGPAMEALAGKTVQGRTIEIRRFEDETELAADCSILFLSQFAMARRSALVMDVADAPVLTIGDSADFVDIGGIVTLEVHNNRVQFAINVGASDRAGLGISAQLLQLASIRN